jgi:hypothetical protein
MKGQHRLPYDKIVAYDPSAKVPLIIPSFPQSYPISTGPSYTIPAFGAIVSSLYKYIKSSSGEIELYDLD